MSSLPSLIDGLDAPWGHYARDQGLVFSFSGAFTDDGAGHVTIPTITIYNPLAGSYIIVVGASFTLADGDALVVDVPPTNPVRTTVSARVVTFTAWGERVYENRDAFVLGLRAGATVSWRLPGVRKPVRVRDRIDLRNPAIQTAFSPGNAFPSVLSLGNPAFFDLFHWQFVKDVFGAIFGIVKVPPGYSGNAKIIADIGASAGGVTRLGASTRKWSDGTDVSTTASVFEGYQNITVVARQRKKITWTFTNTPIADDDILVCQFSHDGADAGDTLSVNTEMYAAYFECEIV